MKQSSKKETIVAVRMPRSLLDELHELKKVNHFMDISDEIRFVIRRYLHDKTASKEENKGVFAELKRKEKLVKDLNEIITKLKEDKDA